MSFLQNINDEYNRNKNFKIGCISPFILILLISLLIYIMEKDFASIFATTIMLALIVFLIVLIYRKSINKDIIDALKIIIDFQKKMGYNDNEIKLFILNKFAVFKKKDVVKILDRNINKNIDVDLICKRLSLKSTNIKYFIIGLLLDVSANDLLLSLEEEKYINNIRIQLKIHSKTYNYLKNNYLKKGLKEERKILEDEERRKTAKEISKSFLPYNAYKILGVSPSITKSKLKKVYRALAKKYHPDKFYGQDGAVIREMENKFQEITEVYEIIKGFKKY